MVKRLFPIPYKSFKMVIFGSILVILCAVFSSYQYEKKQKRKIAFLKELSAFIRHIKKHIEFFSMPVNEIFDAYESADEEIKLIKDGYFEKVTSLDRKTHLEIKSFFTSLGKGFKNDELKTCELILLFLDENIKRLEIEYPNKIKIFRSLSLFIGVSIIILLV